MGPPGRPVQESHRALVVDWLVCKQSGMGRAFQEGEKDAWKHGVEEAFGDLKKGQLLVGPFPE